MIRLRTAEGKRLRISEDVPYIEICDADGNLGALVIQFDNGAEVKIVTPGDSTFDNYVRAFKSKVTQYAERVNKEMRKVEEHDKRKRTII